MAVYGSTYGTPETPVGRLDFLIAEPNRSESRTIAARFFDEWPGLGVRHAATDRGLARNLGTRRFDLVLLSDRMAHRGDLECHLTTIRNDPLHQSVPVTLICDAPHDLRKLEALRWDAHLIYRSGWTPETVFENLSRAVHYHRSAPDDTPTSALFASANLA